MGRISADDLRGIWVGTTMVWDEQDRLEEATYRANTERMCRAGVHGVYTTGSTGEFYALDEDEFRRMVDIQCEVCRAYNMPLQIGCCSDATRKTLRYLEYVAGKPEVGAAQVNIPYWMEVDDRDLLRFFKDLYTACPDLPLVHYNIPRAKRFLTGPDYQRILEVAPNLIGVKFTYAAANFGVLQDALRLLPQLSFFVGENLLVSGMALGARGCYSAIVCTNPSFVLNMYDHAEAGRWAEAFDMQQTIARFLADLAAFIEGRNEGFNDPVIDKGMAVASGCLLGSQRTRAPYTGWSDETVAAVGAWLEQHYPQFVYREATVHG